MGTHPIFESDFDCLTEKTMLPTPDYSCWYRMTDTVYEPSEDTFVFLDGIERELDGLPAGLGLEIGCGSGLVSVAFSKWLKCPVIASDINVSAAECASKMSLDNQTAVDCCVDDVAKAFRSNLFDFILINPPYVVTSSDELNQSQTKKDLSASWAGGKNGTEFLFAKLIPSAVRLKTEGGRIYLIAINDNDISEISKIVASEYGLGCEVVISRKAGRELLY